MRNQLIEKDNKYGYVILIVGLISLFYAFYNKKTKISYNTAMRITGLLAFFLILLFG